jgi:myo-inositol 2-dehydrogenase/D-chiro-inositol 1-dehydrogenase
LVSTCITPPSRVRRKWCVVSVCEKPIAHGLEEIDVSLAAVQAAGVQLQVGFNRRFDANFRRVRQAVESGEIGEPSILRITSRDPAPPPIEYVKVSGGLFKDMAIHDFDMARWLLPEEPVEVFSSATCVIDPAIGAAGDVDTAKTLLRTASGHICLISNSRRSGYGYDQRIEAFCSNGATRADNVLESTVSTWQEDGAASDLFQNFFLQRYAEAYRREMAHFADIIRGAAQPMVGYADAVAALALAEAAHASAASGKAVRA